MFWENGYRRKDTISSTPGSVEIYGTSWCAKTQMVRRFFDKLNISYKFFDLEDNPESIGKLKWITGGYATHPTVVIDGQTLVEPSTRELETIMAKYR
ncbi:MAG TPA: glutaredoxin family protein [Bacteroidales bacterium]|jgi:mycoredoxin|nr:glutaredoxin family protein [Bacteroidales bacterium]